MQHSRNLSIDIARAICIVLVVAGHYFPDNSPMWYVSLRDWIYSFHMPVFMFLSGYVYALTKRDESYPGFVKRKAVRLLVPYFAVSVLILCIKLFSQKLLNMEIANPVEYSSFFRILYKPEAAVHLWFIMALWWIFLIVPLFRNRKSHFLLLAIGIVLHYLPDLIPEVSYPRMFCLDYSALYLVFFALGLISRDLGWLSSGKSVGISTTLFTFYVLNSIFRICPVLDPYIGIAGILSFSTILGRASEKAVSPFLCVSKASFTVYLLHSIFIGFTVSAAKIACPTILDTTGRLFPVGVILIVSISVLCPILVFFLFDRIRRRGTSA